MQVNEALLYVFGEIRKTIRSTVKGLDTDALAWRPDAHANSIAWLIWHLTRVQDDHIAHVAEREQVWSPEWARQFGLPADSMTTGYGHKPEQVAAVKPESADTLLRYQDEVFAMVREYFEGASEGDLDRVVDERYDPPVTAAVRCMSVVGDAYQHVGQAAYIRGLHERR